MSVMELQGQGRDGERKLALGRCQLEFSFRLIAILWKKAYPACRISGLLLDETFSRKRCRAFPVKPRRLSRRGKKSIAEMLLLSTSAAERRAPELSCNGAGQRFIYLIQLVYQLPDKSLMSSGTTGGSRACARKRSPLVFPSEGFFCFFSPSPTWRRGCSAVSFYLS